MTNVVEITEDNKIVVISDSSNAYDRFTSLVDVPNTLVGSANKYVRVNGTETELEFASSVAPTSITIGAGSSFKFFASDGLTVVAEIDESGNLYLKGRVVSL